MFQQHIQWMFGECRNLHIEWCPGTERSLNILSTTLRMISCARVAWWRGALGGVTSAHALQFPALITYFCVDPDAIPTISSSSWWSSVATLCTGTSPRGYSPQTRERKAIRYRTREETRGRRPGCQPGGRGRHHRPAGQTKPASAEERAS